MIGSKHRDELLRIQDELAVSLERASDQEVLDDAIAVGLDPDMESQRFRRIFSQAITAAGKLRLKQAQIAARNDRTHEAPSRCMDLDSRTARARLKQLLANNPSLGGGLMLAARNAGPNGIDKLSDADVEILLEMAIELDRAVDDER